MNPAQFNSCLVIQATKLIAKKWISFIFCQLFDHKKMYFNELYTGINERCGEKISKSVLSESLKGLVDELVITHNKDLFYSPLRVQ